MDLLLELGLAIVVVALVPVGAWVAMGEGMLLHPFAQWVQRTLPPKLHKPLATCPRCMVSGWGLPVLFLAFPSLDWYLMPVVLLAAIGLQETTHR